MQSGGRASEVATGIRGAETYRGTCDVGVAILLTVGQLGIWGRRPGESTCVDAVEVDRPKQPSQSICDPTSINAQPNTSVSHRRISARPARAPNMSQSQLVQARWIDDMAARLGITGQMLSAIVLGVLLIGTLLLGSLRPAVVVEAEKEARETREREKAAKAS